MRHVKVDLTTATRVGKVIQGVCQKVSTGSPASIGERVGSRVDGARMFLAASKARLWSPDPKSSLDTWADEQGEAAYLDLEERYARHPNALLRGDMADLLNHSLKIWPPKRFPTLYQPIPPDLRNPIHWDGKVLGGQEVPTTARRHLSPEVYSAAVSAASKNARILTKWIRTVLLVPGVGLALLYAATVFSAGVGFPKWAAAAGFYGPVFGWYLSLIIDTAVLGGLAAGLALLASRLAFRPFVLFGTNRILERFFDRVQAPLLLPCRDSKLVYAQKETQRDEEYLAYTRQVRAANDERRPLTRVLLPVARARGTLRSRGVMQAPVRDAQMCLDGESIRQHVLILGGTGSGKTRLVIRPLSSRIMTADWGSDRRIGAYITDGKGTLWKDLLFVPGVADRTDVRVVGAGFYDVRRPDGSVARVATYGCNLVQGMEPSEIGDMFEAIYSQLGGRSDKETFWVRNAAVAMQHGASIARFVANCEDESLRDYFEDDLKTSPYTLLGIAQIVYDCNGPDSLLNRCVDFALSKSRMNPEAVPAGLNDALDWVKNSWKVMAIETRSSVLANIGTVIQKLTGSPKLAKAFCQYTLQPNDVVDVDHALNGGILMIAVGEDEFGIAGKIITCCLKTRLYIKAKRRLQVEGREAREQTSVAMIADEFQLLATTGAESDETFWNTARETGVFAVVATQSIAALNARIGESATNNLMDLFRSKIVLATEEKLTQEYCQRLAGNVLLGWKTEDKFFETIHEREKLYPDVGYDRIETSSLDGLVPTKLALQIKSVADIIPQDNRFVDQYSTGEKGQDVNARVNAMKEAWNRFVDRNQSQLTNGLKEVPALHAAELNRGSGIGFVYLQRAGGVRLDVVDFEGV